MAKIKINKLPEGFELIDGKIQESKTMKEGGETVSVDPSMLAKLIAAGADIEML